MTRTHTAKVDFHLHSYASNVTDYYAANTFAIPESYSDPIATYHELRRQGMGLVTLTDHNSIDGVRVLLDKGVPDVFISSELTATFPEDGCNIHVTVANVTEQQFAEANRLPFGLAAYLFTENARTANLMADAVESGMVGINTMAMSAADSPFGGVKDSGHGSEDGPEGMRAFQVIKAIHQH
jgi:hypothetical protein